MVVSPTAEDDPPDPPSGAAGFKWKNLFDPPPPSSSLPSSLMEDGSPVVLAPPDVIFKASQAWTGYIVCHFLGEPPSPAKIFSDLNPVWGRRGSITVRRFSEGTCLVHIPSASARRWVLDVGLWSSGLVSFTVSEWEASTSLVSSPLRSAPTVLTIRGVPPQLWSQSGVKAIAGGVATLIPNARASLPLSSLGTAKLRVVVPLGPPLPPSVIVKDTNGDTVKVTVDYGRLPSRCQSCNSFGHSKHRCPSRRHKDAIAGGSSSPKQSLPPHVADSAPPAKLLEESSSSVRGGGNKELQNPNPTGWLSRPTSQTLQPKDQDEPTHPQPSISNQPTSNIPIPNSLGPEKPISPPNLLDIVSTPSSTSPSSDHPTTMTAASPILTVPPTTEYSSPIPSTNSHIYFSTPSSSAFPQQPSPRSNVPPKPSQLPLQSSSPAITVTKELMDQIANELKSTLSTSQPSPPPSEALPTSVILNDPPRRKKKGKNITAPFNITEAKEWLRSLDTT